MGPLLFLLLLAVPELWVIVQVADRLGIVSTLGLLLLVSIVGAWLLKRQGLATWRRLQATVRRSEMPHSELIDGALILLGGALLLTPGFITDALGFVLVLPPTRSATRGVVSRWLARRARRRFGAPVVVTRIRRTRPARSPAPDAPDRTRGWLPPPPRGPREGDSPGRE